MMYCSAMSVPGMRQFVLRRAPRVHDVPDMGSSWKSFTVRLNLQAHGMNADRCCRTWFDREAPIYRKEEKISVDMMGGAIVRWAWSSKGLMNTLRGRGSHAAAWDAGTMGHLARRCQPRWGRRQTVPLLP